MLSNAELIEQAFDERLPTILPMLAAVPGGESK